MTESTTAASPRWRLRDHVPAIIIVTVGFAITLGLVAWTRGRALRAEQQRLERRAGTITQTLRVSLDVWVEVLHQVATFFESSTEVTREDFASFAGPPRRRYPEIAALEWYPLVRAAERARVEERARLEGVPTFGFTELGPAGGLVTAAERAGYLPMLYMEPSNEAVLGYDLFSDAARRRPAEAARDSGEPVVSPRMVLVEDPDDVYSVAIYKAVYAHGSDRTTLGARREAFTGVVAEILRIRPVIARALQGVDLTGVQVSLLDLSAEGSDRVLWTSRTIDAGGAPLRELHEISFAGRRWAVAFAAPQGRMFGSDLPWGVLGSGVGLSLLIGGAVSGWRMIRRLRRAVLRARTVGAYTLLEKISEGGMGVVYLAHHAMLRRPTALKILQPGRGGETELRRFEREVQMTSRLTHPNTIVIFDYGRTQDATFYYAMEYLDGVTLEMLINDHGAQPPGRIVRIAEQVCGALAEAHSVGLIHRDIKPANIMLCHRGGIPDVVKVLDFGLVKETNADTGVSASGTSYGTPLYLAPESIQHPERIDHRADIYALGLVMYYLASGRRAVTGTSIAEVLHQHMDVVPPLPSHWLGRPLPDGFEAIIMACLEKDPARRPQQAMALRARLLALGDLADWSDGDAEAWWATERTRRPEPWTRVDAELTVDLERRS